VTEARDRDQSVHIDVDLSGGARAVVTLQAADDFGGFKVVARGGAISDPRFVAAISELGTLDDDGHAWLSVDSVRALAGTRSGSAEWAASFSEMLDHAARHGFVDTDRSLVRAHCESDEPQPGSHDA
jgi:hypothetical protein